MCPPFKSETQRIWLWNQADERNSKPNMSLSKQDVKKAAALARIEVTDQEVENALDPLKQVFTLIKEMQNLDTEGV